MTPRTRPTSASTWRSSGSLRGAVRRREAQHRVVARSVDRCSLNPSDARYLYTIANVPSVAGSVYVTFSGQSYNLEPNVAAVPRQRRRQRLHGRRRRVVQHALRPSDAYAAAVGALNEIDQLLILNMNVTDSTVIKNTVSAVAGQQTTFLVVDTPVGTTPAGLRPTSRRWRSGRSGPTPRASPASTTRGYMPALGSAGGRQALHPPGGAVVGAFLATDSAYGAWRTPAGVSMVISGASASSKLTDADLTLLNTATSTPSVTSTGVRRACPVRHHVRTHTEDVRSGQVHLQPPVAHRPARTPALTSSPSSSPMTPGWNGSERSARAISPASGRAVGSRGPRSPRPSTSPATRPSTRPT